MKVLKLYLLLLLLGGFVSCHKKEYPAPVEVVNSAVYYSRLTIDNKPVVLQAGVDGYYMYSSYVLDSSFMYRYVADLRKSDCSVCSSSLKIQINDYTVSISNTSSVDSAVHKGNYPILAGNPTATYKVKFSPITDNNTLSHHWDFGDGSSSDEASPVKEFDKPGKYRVCLTTKSGSFSNPYVSSICNVEKIDLSNKSCKTRIVASPQSGNSIIFSSDTRDGKAPYQYLWNFGDGINSSTQSTYTCNYRARGSYGVSLRVVDALGDTAYATYNTKTLTDNSSSIANYSVSTVTELSPVPAFSKITITWVDENGVLYTSNNVQQPDDSYFEVFSVSENEKNEKGQNTKKINARFKCKLYSGTKSITVNDAEVVLCVAYK